VGAILYNDPADYAKEGQDKVYPHYIWLPKTGAQRGSIFKGRGDPLTPGLPSVEGIFRLPQDKANLPKIPATPMPYGKAVHLLKIMEGKLEQLMAKVKIGTQVLTCSLHKFFTESSVF
jgi:hypothetical protein